MQPAGPKTLSCAKLTMDSMRSLSTLVFGFNSSNITSEIAVLTVVTNLLPNNFICSNVQGFFSKPEQIWEDIQL